MMSAMRLAVFCVILLPIWAEIPMPAVVDPDDYDIDDDKIMQLAMEPMGNGTTIDAPVINSTIMATVATIQPSSAISTQIIENTTTDKMITETYPPSPLTNPPMATVYSSHWSTETETFQPNITTIKKTTIAATRRPPRPVTQSENDVTMPQPLNEPKEYAYSHYWRDFDNYSMETLIIAWISILSSLAVIGTISLCAVRIYYRKITDELLGEIRLENEKNRLSRARNADSKVKHLEPMSPPITDQALYYPLGELLKEDGGVL